MNTPADKTPSNPEKRKREPSEPLEFDLLSPESGPPPTAPVSRRVENKRSPRPQQPVVKAQKDDGEISVLIQLGIMMGLAIMVLVAVVGAGWWILQDKSDKVVGAPPQTNAPPVNNSPPQPAPPRFEQTPAPEAARLSNAGQPVQDPRLEEQFNQVRMQSQALEAEVNQLKAEKLAQTRRLEDLERTLNQERTRSEAERTAANAAREAETQARKAAAEAEMLARRATAEAERVTREATALVAEPITSNASPLGPAAIKPPAKAKVPELDALGNLLNPERATSNDAVQTGQPSTAITDEADESAIESDSAGPDKENRQLLLADIDRALTLIAEDQIEQLISDYFPLEAVRAARSQGVSEGAEELRRTKSALQRLERGLRDCRTATLKGDNDKVYCFADTATSPDATAEGIAIPKGMKGYGKNLKSVIQSGINDLREKKYSRFIENMFPIPEVLRLKQSQLLDLTAQRFVDQPAMAELMLADLEAVVKLDLKPEGGLVRLALSGRNKDETKREVRFQQVAGSWRFFDQSTEIKARQDALLRIEGQQMSDSATPKPILKFERIREHWRLRELP